MKLRSLLMALLLAASPVLADQKVDIRAQFQDKTVEVGESAFLDIVLSTNKTGETVRVGGAQTIIEYDETALQLVGLLKATWAIQCFWNNADGHNLNEGCPDQCEIEVCIPDDDGLQLYVVVAGISPTVAPGEQVRVVTLEFIVLSAGLLKVSILPCVPDPEGIEECDPDSTVTSKVAELFGEPDVKRRTGIAKLKTR